MSKRRVRHKYNAKPTMHGGRRYASKAEARYAQMLEARERAGDVVFFLEQVPMRTYGGSRYYVDFLVFEADGTVRFIDVKGVETQVFKLKKREIEAIYPIEIEVVK